MTSQAIAVKTIAIAVVAKTLRPSLGFIGALSACPDSGFFAGRFPQGKTEKTPSTRLK